MVVDIRPLTRPSHSFGAQIPWEWSHSFPISLLHEQINLLYIVIIWNSYSRSVFTLWFYFFFQYVKLFDIKICSPASLFGVFSKNHWPLHIFRLGWEGQRALPRARVYCVNIISLRTVFSYSDRVKNLRSYVSLYYSRPGLGSTLDITLNLSLWFWKIILPY